MFGAGCIFGWGVASCGALPREIKYVVELKLSLCTRPACATRREAYCQSSPSALLTLERCATRNRIANSRVAAVTLFTTKARPSMSAQPYQPFT
jgi:hypothetical protein